MTFDPELARQERKQRKAFRDAEIERNAVLRQLMSTIEGRRWVHDKLEACSVAHTPWTSDPYATAFNCGQQNIGLQLMAEVIAAAPEFYLEMMQEQRDVRRTEPSAGPDEDGDGDYAAANRFDPA